MEIRADARVPFAREVVFAAYRDDIAKLLPYLSNVRGVDVKDVGPKATLEFRQEVAGSTDPWRFLAANMSDGTLRALGILAALFQSRNSVE